MRRILLPLLLAACTRVPADVDSGGLPAVLVAGPFPSPVRTWDGLAGDGLGTALSSAGDIDGDGFSDVLLGAPWRAGSTVEEGAVELHLGGPSGPQAAAAWTWQPSLPLVQPFARAGTSVAQAGDVDGDGRSDVLVGLPGGGPAGGGCVALFFGRAVGLPAAPDWWRCADAPGELLGSSVASAGDVNADGAADILVGVPGADGSGTDSGRVELFLGGPGGPAQGPSQVIPGTQANSLLGLVVAPAWDVNADGFDDVLVTAPDWDVGSLNEAGHAALHLGGPGGIELAPAWEASGTAAGDRLGAAAAGVGDTDGDGFADVIVGAPARADGAPESGTAWLYRGTPAGLSAPAWSATLAQAGAHLGGAVAPAGDVDGDGFADVLVGAPLWDGPGPDAGRALLFLGGSTGLATAAVWSAEGDGAGHRLGAALSSLGDADADGRSDLLVAAPDADLGGPWAGQVTAWLSEPPEMPTAPTLTVPGLDSGGALGATLAALGDLDQDGFDDLLVGQPGWDGAGTDRGRALLHRGGLGGANPVPAWTWEGDEDGAALGSMILGPGDVDGDGYEDLLLGAPSADSAGPDAGRVLYFRGGATGEPQGPAWTLLGTEPDARLGHAAAGGDIDGDGIADFVISAPMADGGGLDRGQLVAFRGQASGPVALAWTAEGSGDGARLGWALAAGDVDGDGRWDLAASELPLNPGPGVDSAVHVFAGTASGPAAVSAWFTTLGSDAELGSSLALGDAQGDGFADLLVGAPGESRLALWAGSPSWFAGPWDWTVTGPPGSRLGAAVAFAGDIDGDSDADWFAGAPAWTSAQPQDGRLLLFLGSLNPDTASAWDVGLDLPGAALGTAVAGPWDGDGDGLGDLVAGAPGVDLDAPGGGRVLTWRAGVQDGPADGFAVAARLRQASSGAPLVPPGYATTPGTFAAQGVVRSPAGRARASLEVEVESTGTGFDGVGGVLVAPYSDTGPTGAEVQGQVGSLAELQRFAARARWRGDPAHAWPQPWGRWVSLGRGADPLGTHLRTVCADDQDMDQLCGPEDPDDDGDGDPDVDDCAPLDPNLGPSAPELCDAIDQDCDGDLVEGWDDTDADLVPDCVDDDDDGDGDADAVDCAPMDAQVGPSQAELCDESDQDCDGDIVEAFPDTDSDLVPDCVDDDDDNDGSPDALDCADLDPATWPGAPEACDLQDSDCDGDLLDGEPDQDGDGEPDCLDDDDDGDGAPDPSDCGPLDADIFPGAPESCDFVDNDCDGSLTDGLPDQDGDNLPDCVDDDDDGDGSADDLDCAPQDPLVHPGALESCDTSDSDCDGDFVDGAPDQDGDGVPDCVDGDSDEDGTDDLLDCAPLDPAIHPGASEACDLLDADCDGDLVDGAPDLDGDGLPDCVDADLDGDGSDNVVDCEPQDPVIHPGAAEFCDLQDSDCDGSLVDEDPNLDLDAWPDCVDTDDDGDLSPDGLDCEPLDPAFHPGAAEDCDLVDNDCDGSLVDGEADLDGDGLPDCVDPDDDGDLVDDVLDCAPLDGTIHAGAPEACDLIDSDCDGDLVDGYPDAEGDGTPDCEPDSDGDGTIDILDCAPADAGVHPGATDEPDDGIDQDCSGDDARTCWTDEDGDGVGTGDGAIEPAGPCGDLGLADEGGDCDDSDPTRAPGEPELCDGIDQDCDGATPQEEDADLDSVRGCDGDCDDTEARVHPGAPETCDGVDEDCDPGTAPVGGERDMDLDGVLTCAGDCDDEDADVPAAAEGCEDEVDQDCDGTEDVAQDPDCWDTGLPGCGGDALAWLFLAPLRLLGGRGWRRPGRRAPGVTRVTLGLLVALGWPLAAGAAEPRDLLADARQKMAARQWGGAIASLEGAQRIDPLLLEPWVLKARAYEQLGNGQFAEAMWAAAEELSEGAAATEARTGRARAAELRERANQAARRRSLLSATAEGRGAAGGVAGMDRMPFVERARLALKATHCAVARAAALEGTLAAPSRGEPWRVLGDAELCLGHGRAAVSAYRKHLRYGPGDLDVPAIIQELGASLCGLRVLVAGGAQAPVVRLAAEFDEELVIGERGDDLAFQFRDLPALAEFDIRWAGRGVRPGRMTIGPTEAGTVRTVEIVPEIVGVGIIEALGHSPEESGVTLLLPEGDVPLLPGERRVVTAGSVQVLVRNATGEVELALDVPAEGHVRFDPLPWTPAALRIVGGPAGATLSASVTGLAKAVRSAEGEVDADLTGPNLGLDAASGVFLGAAVELRGLIAGDGVLRLVHPLLGAIERPFHLDPMEVTVVEVDWSGMEGLPSVRAAWERHRQERQALLVRRNTAMGVGLGATAVGAGLAIVGAVLLPQQGARIAGARGAAIRAGAEGDRDGILEQQVIHTNALRDQRGALVVTALGGGMAVAGTVVAITFGREGAARLAKAPGWGPLGEIRAE